MGAGGKKEGGGMKRGRDEETHEGVVQWESSGSPGSLGEFGTEARRNGSRQKRKEGFKT